MVAMKLDKLTGKLTMWALLLQEYDFEMIHCVGIINLDANGLSHNPSSSNEDLIRLDDMKIVIKRRFQVGM